MIMRQLLYVSCYEIENYLFDVPIVQANVSKV